MRVRESVPTVLALSLFATAVLAQNHELELTNQAATPFGYVRVADAPELDLQEFTIEMIVTPQGIGFGAASDHLGVVLAARPVEGVPGNWLGSWGLGWIGTNNRLLLWVTETQFVSGQSTTSNGFVPIGTTHHVAATVDAQHLRLYIDGQLDIEVDRMFASIDYQNNDLLFGAANLSTSFARRYDGKLDEVRLWDHARSQAEIQERMNCALHGTEPGLTGYWSFDAGDASDDSGNGHGGALSGTAIAFPPGSSALTCCGFALSYCATSPNSAGPGAVIGTLGSTSIAQNDLVLSATGAVPNGFGLFYYGGGAAQQPFGDGLRCVTGGGVGLFRLSPAMQADVTGQAQRALDFGQPPLNAGLGQATAGSGFYFQYWYRDAAAGGAGFNLSDGMEIRFCP